MIYTHYHIDQSHIFKRFLFLKKTDNTILRLEFELFEGSLVYLSTEKLLSNLPKWYRYDYLELKPFMIAQLQAAINDLANKVVKT